MKLFDKDIEKCKEVLQRGGTILYPTDTIWGIGCDATNEAAVNIVSEIKKRQKNKSFVVLMADVEMLQNYLNESRVNILKSFDSIEEPTTVIYHHPKGIAPQVLAADETVGIRIPNDDFCRDLIHSFGKPIVSTSANFSGELNPSIFSEIKEELKHSVDYVTKWRQEDNVPQKASSILKLNSDGTITRIR